MKTFKVRKGDTVPTAAASVYLELTSEDVAAAEALATAEGDSSDLAWIRKVATEAVRKRLAEYLTSKAAS